MGSAPSILERGREGWISCACKIYLSYMPEQPMSGPVNGFAEAVIGNTRIYANHNGSE